MQMNRIVVVPASLLALLGTPLALAHHSYAEYETDTPSVLAGTIREVQWRNPHIQLLVSDGVNTTRVDWVTVTGAERTGVSEDRFPVGARITITGSRHRNPEQPIMSVVKQIDLPDANWQWKPPVRQ
jgi:hypothetical protein